MNKNETILFIVVSFILFFATSGPVVYLFSEPGFMFFGLPDLFVWNIFVQILVIAWIVYGINKVLFLRGEYRE